MPSEKRVGHNAVVFKMHQYSSGKIDEWLSGTRTAPSYGAILSRSYDRSLTAHMVVEKHKQRELDRTIAFSIDEPW
jgi:hypothetical protein